MVLRADRPQRAVTVVIVVAAIVFAVLAVDSTSAQTASPGFKGSIGKIDRELRQRLIGSSWHRGCPVPVRNLRLLTLRHWNFNHQPRTGYLVVNADSARGMYRAMRELYESHFVIRRMRLVDAYGADDHRSMNADNTSAFNCREVAGSPGVWSDHAYGRAIDLNPRENPYVTTGGHVSPPAGRPYADRTPRRKGMVGPGGGKVARIFADEGWLWGGNWSGETDYQHFYISN